MPGRRVGNSFTLGVKAKDGTGVNPNILRRTIFENIDVVSEAWEFDASHVAIDTDGGSMVGGRRSVRLDASALDQYVDFQQNVYGRVKPNTWYTLSFHCLASANFDTFLYDQSGQTRWTDAAQGCFVDGSGTPAQLGMDGRLTWAATPTGVRHWVTFRTGSSFSTRTLWVLFRARAGGSVAICMPKLEEGRVATAYIPHEEDLVGRSGVSPVYADLTNECDGVVCDSTGYTIGQQSVSTKVLMGRGNTPLPFSSIICQIEGYTLGIAYTNNDDPTKQFRALTYTNTGTVVVYVRQGTYMKSRVVSITVKSGEAGETVTRTLELSISGAWAGVNGEPAVVYNLMPSMDVVSCDSDNIPRSDSIAFRVMKNVGGGATEVESWENEGLALYHSIGDGEIQDGTAKGAVKTITGIQNGLYYENSFVEWILKKNGIVVDREGIGTVSDGVGGEQGPGGEAYSIMSTLGSITIGPNTTSGTFTAEVSFYKKVGSAARVAYPCYCSVFMKKGSSYTYIGNNGSKTSTWYADGISVVASTCDALVFCIYDSMSNSHSGYLAELEIPVYKQGDTGPSYWPSGSYDPLVTYRKIGNRTPMVFVEDESMTVWNEYAQAYGEYWYLTADTNVVNGTHYKPQDGSSYWAKAENYGVVLVGAHFARFAKNGAGVMAGDYYYSANGRIDGVERVDGQGADGSAVSASNPPAYTRFMGDPTIQNGYLNRVNLQGPVLDGRARLATVYLLKGVSLNIRVKGSTYYDGTTNKNAYFRVYRDQTGVGGTGIIYRIQRELSLTYTAAETGEYTICYWGQDTSTKATFFLRWEVSGHFYPNWWVDLKTGKMHGAKDNFIIDGEGGVKVNGAMMTHKVKLQASYSKWVTYPDHASGESDYWDTGGDVYLYEPQSDGLPVRVYSEPDAIYYGLRSCRLLYDQVYVGVVGAAGRRVVIYLPPPHLFIGQRIAVTNNTTGFPQGSSRAGVFLQMDYMFYTRTDYTEGICLTGQEAYFEDDETGAHDSDGKNGKPYIVGVPEVSGSDPIPACGIWTGENVQAVNGVLFISNLVDEMNIEEYEWMELTAVRGYLAEKYEGTSSWKDTMSYNAYWMLTRWKKKT